MKTIIFCFAGRESNIRLQLPFIKRILATHSDTYYHIWDLSGSRRDHEYLATLDDGGQITVIDMLYGEPSWETFNHIFWYYAEERFHNQLFVKLDEDIVFLEDARWDEFIATIDANRDSFVSPNIINNGACIRVDEVLQRRVKAALRTQPLSDYHKCPEAALVSHNYFFEHWRTLVNQPVKPVDCIDWLSINVIGYPWQLGVDLDQSLRTGAAPTLNDYALAGVHNVPREIAQIHQLGDEGAVNTHPRLILQGFTAAHLYFGPQRKRMGTSQIINLQNKYGDIGGQYRQLFSVDAEKVVSA